MKKSTYQQWSQFFEEGLEQYKQRKEQETIKELMKWDIEDNTKIRS